MPELTRQDVDLMMPMAPSPDSGAPLNNFSLEKFAEVLEKFKNGVDAGSEVAYTLLDFLYKSDNDLANKILKKYRTDCLFRKAIRNATLDALNNAGLIYSRRRDKTCITSIDNAFLAASLASLAVNIAVVVNQFYKA